MATTNTRSRTTGSRTTTKSRAPSVAGSSTKSSASSTRNSASSSPTARQSRYSNAAIATGAVVAAAAAGAFFFSRRDRTSPESGETMTNKVKGSFADARARIKDLVSSDASSSDQRSQHDIAEEALKLKESGGSGNAFDDVSKRQSKTGAIAY